MKDEVITGDAPEKEKPVVYKDIYEVPEAWRTYRSARLSVPQINEIIKDAYHNSLANGLPDYGGAKERFEAAHTIEDGFWVETEGKEGK
jgi:hypothetical protein